MIDKHNLKLIVLGNAQDAGFPQATCYNKCCVDAWKNQESKRFATSIAIVDLNQNQWYLIDATPDIKEQLHLVHEKFGSKLNLIPDKIFLTHGHIGHYTGLIQFSQEAIASKNLEVFAMPKMNKFLNDNVPFNLLIKNKNIFIKNLENEKTINVKEQINITPILVPHRDEYTETVCFKIETKNKKVLFIPDIDAWNLWNKDILTEIKNVDFAFLDGSFYNNKELPNTDMSKIPHPTICDSFELFKNLTETDKKKIHFIHFNHTNPVFRNTKERKNVLEMGFNLAEQGAIFNL